MQTFTTRYQRWPTQNRGDLFPSITFVLEVDSAAPGRILAKHSSFLTTSALKKIRGGSTLNIGAFRARHETENYVFYQEATQYWAKATSVLPFYAKNGVRSAPAHGRYMYFDNPTKAGAASALLNSSLFYAYFIAYGDCFHLSDTLAAGFPTNAEVLGDARLAKLNTQLMAELDSQSERKMITSRRGGAIDRIEYDEYQGSRCKNTIDKIDSRLTQLYGLSDAEADFIINYDIKYRMGSAGEDE